RHRLNTLSRLTDITASHCARSILRRVVSRVMPAALTRMSSEPCACSTPATKAAQASKSDTSSAAKRMSSPSTCWPKRAMRSGSVPRSAAMTRRPARARWMQIAEPSPPMPPVTTATRLFMGYPGTGAGKWCCSAGGARRRGGSGAARSAAAALRIRLLADAAGQVLLEFLPHFHVALGELVHHRPRRLAEHAAHLLAELRLLVEEHLH